MWVFWNAWHSTAFVSHNSDLCQIWERALGRAAFFKIWSCFSRQNKYGFDFHVIFEVVVCSCLCVVLWHKNLQRSFLGTVQAKLECHLILLVKLESFKGSPQVQVDGRKLFPCLLARNLWCLSAESDGASVTVVVIKFPAGLEALNCVCTFEIRGLFLSLLAYLSEKRFTFLTQISQKKTHFAFGRLSPLLCLMCGEVTRWHHDTDVFAPCSSSWEFGPRSWMPERITWNGACRGSWTAPLRNRQSPTCARSSGSSAKG